MQKRKKEKEKGVMISNFALLLVVFEYHRGSEGVKVGMNSWSGQVCGKAYSLMRGYDRQLGIATLRCKPRGLVDG